MREYFVLQFKLTNRKLRDAGINPAIGYVLGLAGFMLLSAYLFQKTEFAEYVLLLVAISLLFNLSEVKRNEFLLSVFGETTRRNIRIVENLSIGLPFAIALTLENAFFGSVLLIAVSIALASFSFNSNLNYTLPTPFYKRPFEFVVGFRNTFYIFPLAYILTFIAVSVGNLNLGIFAMLLIFVVILTFFIRPENEYFVWIYSASPVKFLFEKLATATLFSFLLALPTVVGLLVFFSGEAGLILLFLVMALTFLLSIILAKYSAYPNEMNLPEVVLIAICIYFPPGLLAVIPFFYIKAVTKLNPLLR